jgi:DNA-binding NarL/FixJ family response regulator
MERVSALARLRELRTRLVDQVGRVGDLIDEFAEVVPDFDARPPSRAGAASPAPDGALTARELAVLAEMAAGKTNAQIASTLFVSETTVKYHVRNVLRKLGAANRAEAVSRYHRRGRSRPNE